MDDGDFEITALEKLSYESVARCPSLALPTRRSAGRDSVQKSSRSDPSSLRAVGVFAIAEADGDTESRLVRFAVPPRRPSKKGGGA
jgi:hypothetical protein